MTIIRFTYSAGYHRPATGGVVFMPHRKHAANETVVLPRPFTRTLVDGVVEVDLEPTSDDWLWSVTHDQDTRFYAIPDTDGVTNHTDLIPVAPSTLTHRIEPVWWAELRQHQQFITDYVNESRSNVREAIDTVNTVHTTLKTAVTDAQRHESVAGAYSRQAQASATEAWEASKGPDGAAARAKAEADRAEIYRDEANTHRIQADTSAKNAVTARTQAQAEADRAEAARDAAETYRDESVAAKDESVAAKDDAEDARNGMIIDATIDGDRLIFQTVNGGTIDAGKITDPITEIHAFLAVGQSNMVAPGKEPGNEKLYTPHSRILQYGANTRTITPATIPLDMPENPETGLSPATVFAHEYVKYQPDNVAVLIIPAARGGTNFTSSPGSYTWNHQAALANDQPERDLYQLSVDQTQEALSEDSRVVLKAILWHQGEGSSSEGREQHLQHVVDLIEDYRSDFDIPDLPFIVGQMNPNGFSEGRKHIDLAHQSLHTVIPHTAFARSTTHQNRFDDPTHFNIYGVKHIGKTMHEALPVAIANNPESNPLRVRNIEAEYRNNTIFLTWDAPYSAVDEYRVRIIDRDGQSHIIDVDDGVLECELEITSPRLRYSINTKYDGVFSGYSQEYAINTIA